MNNSTYDARAKIRSIDELAAIAARARAENRTVVLCHGVFDLVHMGHVRHIEAARREGDLLIVTLTDDAHVNKGPGRPIFSERLRAEMIAAFRAVDWVGVNHAPSAETVLKAIRPNVYVKGSDYENPDEDITGKIQAEREAIEAEGGRIVFTHDITFSSSKLINRYLDVYDPPLRDYLDDFRQRVSAKTLLKSLDAIQDFRVVLIGDAIIDEYQYVRALGKAAKDHMIASLFEGQEVFAGGVFATANHVASFCREVEIITALGGDASFEEMIRRNLKPNVTLHTVTVPGRPTTRKCRFVEPNHMRKLFEVYFMDDRPIDAESTSRIERLIRERVPGSNVVIVNDFGHGLIDTGLIETMVETAPFLAVNTQVNSANHGYNLITKYPRADYICVDMPEARLALADKFSDPSLLAESLMPARVPCGRMVITHGSHGCFAYSAGRGVKQIPAFTKTIVDTVGAGDAFLAVTAPLAAAGIDMELAAFIGNAAGATKVGIVGHRSSVEKVPLMKFINTLIK